jgi:DNA-binding NarL/FixJ family response regulator
MITLCTREMGKTVKQRIQVLIADDRLRCRDGLRALLANWPTVEVVCEATDGWEAVQLVEERQPDVVLMDVRMPVLDGLEATRIIKSRWPEVKVIVLTMYAVYRADALAAGADGFVLKGCPTENLLEAISCHQKSHHDAEEDVGGGQILFREQYERYLSPKKQFHFSGSIGG